jgi:ABC-type branched-subunit amino acid transport system permease subunit
MNALRKKDLLTLVACAVLFAVMQGLMMAEIIGPFWELNIVLICINIILSVSLNLINGYTGQFSIGHAGFLAVGAYTGAIVTVKLGFSYELLITEQSLRTAQHQDDQSNRVNYHPPFRIFCQISRNKSQQHSAGNSACHRAQAA